MTRAELYIAWNNALVDYFITTSTSTVFYVTDSKIESIGQKYNIEKKEDETFVKCYINAISFFIEKDPNAGTNHRGRICYEKLNNSIIRINDLFSSLYIKGYRSPSGELSKDYLLHQEFGKNRATILDLAFFLAKHKIFKDLHLEKELQYPYFSYIIFVLLGFNKSENRQWRGVEDIFQSNGIYFGNNDREKVASLFEHLINEDKVLTSSCVQTDDPFIKYLKYHSVLKPGDKRLFDDILYNHHIQWNSNLVYGELRDLIWRVGIKNTTQYAKLREALLKTDARPYFESLIKEFDREEYALQLVNNDNGTDITSSKKGCFRYVIDYMSRTSMIWLQYVKPEYAVSNNGITLTPLHVYADNCRVDLENEVIAWADYTNNGLSYKDSKYYVSSNKTDVYFFEIIEGRFLAEMIEPEQLSGKACFLVLLSTKKGKDDVIQYHNAQPINQVQLPVFGNGWEVYYVPQYEPKKPEVTMEDNQSSQLLKYAQVCFDNCITVSRNTYLLEAFPYIITEGINPNDVSISICDINDTTVSFERKIVGNRIYLHNFDVVPCGEIRITITADGIEETRSYRVTSNGLVQPATDKVCARFDKWGCLDNNLQDEYYSDNEVNSSTLQKPKTQSSISSMPDFEKDGKDPYHRLMSILYSIGNGNASKYTFSSSDLDNVLMYLADFEGEELAEKEIKRLKYALRDLGIVTHYYKNGEYVYETNSPRLTPLLEGRHLMDGECVTDQRRKYLLYGTYSQKMYDDLYSAVDHFEYKPLGLSDKLDKYLPPYIVVALRNDQVIDSIQKCESSHLEDLMTFAGKVPVLDQDTNVFKKYYSIDNNKYSYPVMVPSDQERGRKEMLRLSANEVLDNKDLSPDLLYTYVRHKHEKPVWFAKALGGEVELYFKSEWQLPFYLRKALVSNKYALPQYLYSFGMNDIFGEESIGGKERLFSKMYMYRCHAEKQIGDTLGVNLCQIAMPNPSTGLKMYAIKSTENGLTNWLLVVEEGGKTICYTTQQDKVFYLYNNKYVEVISNKTGQKTINAKLSAVLELHFHCTTSKFDINEWVKNYLCLNCNVIDTSTITDGEKYEVKIIQHRN